MTKQVDLQNLKQVALLMDEGTGKIREAHRIISDHLATNNRVVNRLRDDLHDIVEGALIAARSLVRQAITMRGGYRRKA